MESKQKMSLTPDQNNQLDKITKIFFTTPSLIDRTTSYYLQFKSNVGNVFLCFMSKVPSHQLLLALKCAFFMAEKSEVMENLKGEKIRGVGLSLSNLIKSHKSDEVICMLRQFSKKVTIKDPEANAEIRNIIEQISLLVTFSDKFQKIITKLELKSTNFNQSYENIFTSFAWLLFVESKKTIFPHTQEIIENTCLLSHVISFMLIFGWNFIKPEFLLKGDLRLNETSSLKEVSICVKNKLFDMLKITNLNFYQNVAAEFEKFFNEKIEMQIIRHAANSHFLSPEMIENNYKKLDQFYNKNIDINGLDHRIFYKERTAIFTPSRFTPIYKHGGYLNKGINKGKIGCLNITEKGKDNFTSHRVLTFDHFDRTETIDPKAPTYTEITKFPKNIMHSPSVTNIPLIQTPLSAGMDMYNYLNNKSKKYNENSQLYEKDFIVLDYIQKFFSKQKKARAIEQIKKKLVFSLFKVYLAEFNDSNPKQVCHDIEQALLALILEMVCFVNNIHMEFKEIQADLELTTYFEWKICDFLLKNDRSMPIPLKAHILDLEVSFVTQKIWLEEDIVGQICRFFSEDKTESPLKRKVEKLCARIVFQIAFQINQISNFLKIPEEFSEKVFQVLKNLLEEHIEIYENRSMDQLVLCAFYLVAKVEKSSYTLGEFKQAYFEMNPQNAKDHQKLLLVNTPEFEETSQLNLVQFYNKLFLQFAKTCLKFEKNQQQTESHLYKDPNQAKLLLQSPLKTIIPRQTNLLNKNIDGNQGAKNKNKTHLTPQLYAYTESPLLKNQFNALNAKAPIGSRKVLDYQKEEAKIIMQKNAYDKEEIPESKPNMDEFFNIKFKQTSTQKSNIENISPRNLTNQQSRKGSFAEPKTGPIKTGLFANIQANMQNLQTYHLNIK